MLYEERPKNDIDIRIRKDTDFPLHFHHCLEIIYIFDGTQKFYVENTEYNISKGDLLIIFPYQIHEFIRSCNKSILIIIDTYLLNEYNNEFNNYKPVSPVIKSHDLPLNFESSILYLISINNQPSSYNTSITKGIITVIIGEIFKRIKIIENNNTNCDLMRRVISYCMRNYKSPDMSMQKMSSDLKMSQSYLSHFLADKLHTNYNTYINSLRIDNACNLLNETALSVIDIAFACGYNNLRTFNRAFKKHKSKSPTEYKKENKN
ncbi:MAG: AraC family transcriptional regulator [Eubacteriales bacterium]|nr:AraC family transcriptional regulator [Eubacteriales bacterium]